MTESHEFWVHDTDCPGVSAQDITVWEARHGVRLPQLLADVLTVQDGGCLGRDGVEIYPLAEMQPADEDWWEWVVYDLEDEIEGYDRSLVFWLGTNEFGGEYLLDYNPNGRRGEPVVIEHYSDPGDAEVVADSLAGFFEALTARSETPLFDWHETEELDEVIAAETFDLSAAYGPGARVEQVLGRQGGKLVLFVHKVGEGEERFEKTVLPEPLDGDWYPIEAFRPAPSPSFALTLQPEDSDGILQVASTRRTDGESPGWRNQETEGAPVYVAFESAGRKKLEDLRTRLFGHKAAEAATRRDAAQEEMQRQFNALSEPDQQTAGLAMLMQMQGELTELTELGEMGDTSDMPPELAQIGALLQKKMDEAVRRTQEMIAANPPDPEAARAIERLLELQRQAGATGDEDAGGGEEE
jgi:hypothetical protein